MAVGLPVVMAYYDLAHPHTIRVVCAFVIVVMFVLTALLDSEKEGHRLLRIGGASIVAGILLVVVIKIIRLRQAEETERLCQEELRQEEVVPEGSLRGGRAGEDRRVIFASRWEGGGGSALGSWVKSGV